MLRFSTFAISTLFVLAARSAHAQGHEALADAATSCGSPMSRLIGAPEDASVACLSLSDGTTFVAATPSVPTATEGSRHQPFHYGIVQNGRALATGQGTVDAAALGSDVVDVADAFDARVLAQPSLGPDYVRFGILASVGEDYQTRSEIVVLLRIEHGARDVAIHPVHVGVGSVTESRNDECVIMEVVDFRLRDAQTLERTMHATATTSRAARPQLRRGCVAPRGRTDVIQLPR